MKINFSFETEYGKFADALHLPDDQLFTDTEIELMKQQRLNNWLFIVSNTNTNDSEEII